MRTTQIIEKDELEDLLLSDGAGLITDELMAVWHEAQKQLRLHGDCPSEDDEKWSKYIDQEKGVWTDLEKMKEFEEECHKYFDKTDEINFEDKIEEKIMKIIYEYLVEES